MDGVAGLIVVIPFLLVAWLIAAATLYVGPPPLPMSRPARAAVGELLPEPKALPTGAVVELGTGWGGLLVELARRYPDRDVRGYEVSPLPWAVTWLRLRLAGLRRARVLAADFRRHDLSDAALLTGYLGAASMRRLSDKLARELKPGARIISVAFALPGWLVADHRRCGDFYGTTVYVFIQRDRPSPANQAPSAHGGA